MTSHVAQYKEHLRALFKDNPERSQQILQQMGPGPWEGTGRLNLAVFGMAMEKGFQGDTSHEAVKEFVDQTSQALAGAADQPKPLHIELMVRAALGEPELLDEVTGEAKNTIMPIAAYVVVKRLEMSNNEVDELVDRAAAAVS